MGGGGRPNDQRSAPLEISPTFLYNRPVSLLVAPSGSHEQRRAEIVDKLLADQPVDAGELAELGYELDGWHLGMIATGPQVGKAVRALAAGLGCELLPVAHGGEMVWAWLGARRRVAFAEIERVFSAGEYLDLSLAIGEPGRGASTTSLEFV
jgi:hypothetical protein